MGVKRHNKALDGEIGLPVVCVSLCVCVCLRVCLCLCLFLLRIPISLHRSGDYSSWGPGKIHYNTNHKMQYSMINVGEQKHRLRKQHLH